MFVAFFLCTNLLQHATKSGYTLLLFFNPSWLHGLPCFLEILDIAEGVVIREKVPKHAKIVQPFICEEPGCGFLALKQVHLKKHVRFHAPPPTYYCDMCEYLTPKKHTLIVHKRRHTGVKPFACDSCDYKAAKSGNLAMHKRKHVILKCHYIQIYSVLTHSVFLDWRETICL